MMRMHHQQENQDVVLHDEPQQPDVNLVHKQVQVLNKNIDVVTAADDNEVMDEDLPVDDTASRKVYSWTCLSSILIPAALVFIVVFTKTRTIVLARQLIAQIEAVEAEGSADVEMTDNNSCCDDKDDCESKETAPEPAAQPAPVAIYSPESVYIVADASAYPGQLTPVYVNKLGQSVQ